MTKAAAEFRAEAARMRKFALTVADPEVVAEIHLMVAEWERRASVGTMVMQRTIHPPKGHRLHPSLPTALHRWRLMKSDDRDPRAHGEKRLVKIATSAALLALVSTLYSLIGLAVWPSGTLGA